MWSTRFSHPKVTTPRKKRQKKDAKSESNDELYGTSIYGTSIY